MTEQATPPPEFTPDARKRWGQIPPEHQKSIVDSVWCGNCCAGVSMILSAARMKKDFLILEGKCKNCGNDTIRSVEPE